MPLDKPLIQTKKQNTQASATIDVKKTIYYGKVVSIDDPTDGGRIKVRISGIDNRGTAIQDLAWCYPMLPKYFHVLPQKEEIVRIFMADNALTERGRYWLGSIVSQPQKIGKDPEATAYSTTEVKLSDPEKAPSTYPDADGVFPTKDDVAIIGKVNTDIILRVNQLHLRAGKHEEGDILKLNTKNPAQIGLVYEPYSGDTTNYYSNTIIQGDKIALISHDGNPNFKAARMTEVDRLKVFANGHPIARADVLIEALEVIRNALINHIHGYSALPADKNDVITRLESLQLEAIKQKNIVTN